MKFTIGLPLGSLDLKKGFQLRGFALLNGILVAAAAAMIAPMVLGGSQEVAKAKGDHLEDQVQSLNAAVAIYRNFGGKIGADATPAEVIAQLQTASDSLASGETSRFTGSLVDRRLAAVTLAESERATLRPRVVWDGTAGQFAVTTEPVGGVAVFSLEESPELNIARTYVESAGLFLERTDLGLR